MKLPILVINFKTYSESTGENAVKLAKICEKVANETKKSIAVAVTAPDIYRVSQAVSIPVFAQHLDNVEPGAHTGSILLENLKQNGAAGTLMNHSEDQYRIDFLQKDVKKAKQSQLATIVCANNVQIAKAVAAFEPDMIAVEPPELIGGDVSVSKAKPEIIKDTVKAVKKVAKIPVLCGAGVQNAEDVKIALKLGSKGILIASAVVKAQDQEAKIRELVSAF